MSARAVRIASIAIVAVHLSGVCSKAQETKPEALWNLYFSAGADAAGAENWPEAEALFGACVEKAQKHSPVEPYLTFAKYSLAAAYYQEGRYTDAKVTLDPLRFVLDPKDVRLDLRESVDALTSLGNLFYSLADKESKDPKRIELQGDARTKVDDDINQKNRFARRYYQWAFVIDQQVLPPDSPELDDPAEWAALMDYIVGDYAAAVAGLTDLLRSRDASERREKALSNGSMVYSLASKRDIGQGPNSLKTQMDISVLIAQSYEVLANGAAKEKPLEAVHYFALAEPFLKKYVEAPNSQKPVRDLLLRIYKEHAELLLGLKDPAAAAAVEKKARPLQVRQEKPS